MCNTCIILTKVDFDMRDMGTCAHFTVEILAIIMVYIRTVLQIIMIQTTCNNAACMLKLQLVKY